MKRYGSVIRLRPDTIAAYRRIHAEVWPDILGLIAKANIRNYSIYLKEPENLLFSYYEYHGTDHAADMARLAAEPRSQEWWTICDPMQVPFETRRPGEWWAAMEEVFHTD